MKRTKLAVTLTLSVVALFMSLSANAQSLSAKQMTAEFDKILNDQFKPDGTGCAALVAKEGQVIYRKGFGLADLELNVPMRPEMVFRIGSITKQFTAIAILQLMEQGKLSLQDEITRYIPDYPMHGHSITIEHLLTHTSGIKSYTNVPMFREIIRTDMKPEEIIEKNKALPMEFAPGTKWNYNNSGYIMLGYIIEKVSGKTYAEYLQENFFTPLGMTSSYYGDDTKIIKNRASGYQPGEGGTVNADYLSMTLPYAAGSIMSTVDDLYKWNRALHSYKLVRKETLDMAHTSYKLADGKPVGYGYGWSLSELQGSRSIEHGGGINGYLSYTLYLPEEDLFVALLSNSNGQAPEFSSLRMAAIAIGKPLKTTELKLDEAALNEYQGIYLNDEGKEARIVLTAGKLSAVRPGGSRRIMIPVERDMFLIENSFTSVKFSRDAAGKLILATFDDRGDVTEWKRSDKPLETKKATEVDEAVLDKYVGEYEIQPGFSIVFTREGARLFTQATGQSKFEVFAESETKFFLKAVDAQIEFIAEEDGTVNKLILHQGGHKIEGKRIK
jgi:CubicO group peptidase (beta-lactamase class C family)